MFKFTAAEEAAQDRAERAEEAFAAEGIEEPGMSVFDFSAADLAAEEDAYAEGVVKGYWEDSISLAASEGWFHFN